MNCYLKIIHLLLLISLVLILFEFNSRMYHRFPVPEYKRELYDYQAANLGCGSSQNTSRSGLSKFWNKLQNNANYKVSNKNEKIVKKTIHGKVRRKPAQVLPFLIQFQKACTILKVQYNSNLLIVNVLLLRS